MTQKEIRRKFLEFFKDRGHAIVASSSLISDDPSVLLTTAGMQQFKRYFTGELDPVKDFGSKNTVSIQKSFRTSDIDEVGDESHLTFFEMLGNFSFGGYFKEDAIKYAFDFITSKEWMGLEIDYVSIFQGDKEVPADEESKKIWNSLGVKNVKEFGREDNFWGPTGSEGPCGPTTEIYIKTSEGKSVEIWNIVFNEYYCNADKSLRKLDMPGVDTGMGLERLAMVSQKVSTIFETDLFAPIMRKVDEMQISRNLLDQQDKQTDWVIPPPASTYVRSQRIIADHIRASTFIISDGVVPSNTDRGYILRRLLRRAMRYELLIGSSGEFLASLAKLVIGVYRKAYPELESRVDLILTEIKKEEDKFGKTLEKGLQELNKLFPIGGAEFFEAGKPPKAFNRVDPQKAFYIYQTYGFPLEIIQEELAKRLLFVDNEEFDEEFKKHQEISRAGLEAKFGGHGLYLKTGEVTIRDQSEVEKVTRLHTATHLLHQSLRQVLGPEVRQNGSDITVERTRFDFNFPRKLTPEELKQVENLVNQKIKEDLTVGFVELPKADAEKTGALYFFREKYPDKVKVYFVGPTLEMAWSKEFCGGPHVKRTSEVGAFRILKEEAVGSGLRRIRATVE